MLFAGWDFRVVKNYDLGYFQDLKIYSFSASLNRWSSLFLYVVNLFSFAILSDLM